MVDLSNSDEIQNDKISIYLPTQSLVTANFVDADSYRYSGREYLVRNNRKSIFDPTTLQMFNVNGLIIKSQQSMILIIDFVAYGCVLMEL